MVMLDVKKSYAYRQIAAEAKINPETNELVKGKIFENPIIEKKSGLGVKTDTIDLTKEILDFLINTALNDQIQTKDKYNYVIKELQNYYNMFKTACDNFDVYKIGTPVRWQKKINAINAMLLYNATVEKSFQYLSTGHLIYCNFSSLQILKNLNADLPLEKLNAIAFPAKFSVDTIKENFKKYGISIDLEKQWNNILNKTCHRLLEGIKRESSKHI